MSINSLANAAAARRTDVGAIDTAPGNLAQIAAAAATPPDIATPKKQEASGINTALNVLFGYIPTEVVVLYVAVVGALQPAATPGADAAPAAVASASQLAVTPDAGAAAASLQSEWIAFWCFLVATPLAVWAIYASKIKVAGKPLPVAYSTLPLWEMTAALIAFFAWAFALPNTPFRDFNWHSPALASIAVLVVSTVLGLMAPLFQNKLEVHEPAQSQST
jgi:hypothetical protein